MSLRAQTSMYWIGIGKQKESAITVEVPSRPWQKLGMDLFSRVVIGMALLLIITQSTHG